MLKSCRCRTKVRVVLCDVTCKYVHSCNFLWIIWRHRMVSGLSDPNLAFLLMWFFHIYVLNRSPWQLQTQLINLLSYSSFRPQLNIQAVNGISPMNAHHPWHTVSAPSTRRCTQLCPFSPDMTPCSCTICQLPPTALLCVNFYTRSDLVTIKLECTYNDPIFIST